MANVVVVVCGLPTIELLSKVFFVNIQFLTRLGAKAT